MAFQQSRLTFFYRLLLNTLSKEPYANIIVICLKSSKSLLNKPHFKHSKFLSARVESQTTHTIFHLKRIAKLHIMFQYVIVNFYYVSKWKCSKKYNFKLGKLYDWEKCHFNLVQAFTYNKIHLPITFVNTIAATIQSQLLLWE